MHFRNQYPSDFYYPIINKALNKIKGLETEKATETGFDSNQSEDEQSIPKKLIFIEYRGKSQEIERDEM